MLGPVMRRDAGLTLLELMVVVALIGVIVAIAAPAFGDMIKLQRLRSVSSELVTDLQLARSEAVSRRDFTRVFFKSDTNSTCYTVYTTPDFATRCDCLLGPGAACTGSMVEIKTVKLQRSLGVIVESPGNPDPAFAFDWRTGGLFSNPTDNDPIPMSNFVIESYLDGARKLSTRLNRAGRPLVCSPTGSTMSEQRCAP